MITGDQYRDRIARLKPNVYMGGKMVDRFDPRLIGGINVMAKTYDFAFDPEFQESTASTTSIRARKTCSTSRR